MNNIDERILALCDSYKIFSSGGARVALMENRAQDEYKFMFGFWQFSGEANENDQVFTEMEAECAKKGITKLIGPMNYNSWFDYRLALDNFDVDFYPDCPGSAAQTEFLTARGYTQVRNYTSKVFESNELPSLLKSMGNLEGEYQVITKRGAATEDMAEVNYAISLECFAGAFLYTPISLADYKRIYLEPYRSADIEPFVVHILHKGEPVAFHFSYNLKHSEYYITKTAGIKEAYRSNRRMLLTLLKNCITNGLGLGYTKFVSHFRRDDQLLPLYGDKTLIKTYGIFAKEFKK